MMQICCYITGVILILGIPYPIT
uniref:Uncharacterized protein n=1 Tax=Rhizophora mucronata TaxID=61149 RepID=A0A2P2PN30_RHIMU